jgi:hypothetical protein
MTSPPSGGLEFAFTLPASPHSTRSASTRRVRRSPSLPCYR